MQFECIFSWGFGLPQAKPDGFALARPQALRFSRKLYRYAKGPISEGAGIERSEMTGGVPSGVPERADFPSFRPKFHVLGRKSQMIKQNAQKGGAKFGGGGLDRS